MTPRGVRLCCGLLILAAVHLSACDRSSSSTASSEPSSAPATAGSSAPHSFLSASEPIAPGLEGAVIEIEEDRVTLRALRAPRVHLLRKLGERAGFKVTAAPIEPKEISVELVAVSLPQAVAALLRDVPHALSYEPNPEGGEPRLARVRVGSGEFLAQRAQRRRETLARLREQRARNLGDPELAAEPGGGPARSARLRERRRRVAEQSNQTLEPRRPRRGKDPTELEGQLEDPDPQVRAAAVAEVRPHDEGLVLLQSILAEDPDPQVRAAAANRMVDADSVGAARSLLAALDDPDSEVVLAVIDTLEYWQDPSLIPDLEPLLDHPDPEVSEAASEAIDFLQ